MTQDSKSSCQFLRLEVKDRDTRSRSTCYIDVAVSDLIKTDVKVWELESIYLEPVPRHLLSRRTIGETYRIKSDPSHYLTHLWLSGWDAGSRLYGKDYNVR